MNGSIDTSGSSGEDICSPTSSSSSSCKSSRYAHLWASAESSSSVNSPTLTLTNEHGNDVVSSTASICIATATTEVTQTIQPLVGLHGFGELKLGDDPTTSVSTTTYSEQVYNMSSANVFDPSAYASYINNCAISLDTASTIPNSPCVSLTPGFKDEGNLHGFGHFYNKADMGNYDALGLRREFGFEAPLMSSSPFHSTIDVDDTTQCLMNSSLHGSSRSATATLNEITTLLGDTGLDWSNSVGSRNGNPIWSSSAISQFVPEPRSGLTIKQTIHYLQHLQEIQDSTTANLADPVQRNQVCSLITTLQQNLLSQYASPNPSGSDHSYNSHSTTDHLQRAARFHREVAGLADARVTWSGNLPVRNNQRNPAYSCKVFLGGVPWDITESALMSTFRQFGNAKVEWPGKDGNQPKGYAYIIFDSDKQVKSLLQNCTHDYIKGADYFKLSSRRTRSKDVQVIPWALTDSNFVRCPATKLDPQKTIFVGALHGMLNAEGLCHIMQELFGGVVYAGIDTDRHKYPIGSGRITFNNTKSYMKAVAAAFIEIRTSKFTKKVQVDPYLEDATCSVCNLQQGPYFCRDIRCFNYFCRTCFQYKHTGDEFRSHRPLMRNTNKPHGGPVSIMPSNFSATSSLTEMTNASNKGCHQFGFQRFYR